LWTGLSLFYIIMKLLTKLSFLSSLMIAGLQLFFAHAIWMETSALGSVGKEQIVKIFYGEYEESEIENTSNWYSDLKQMQVFVVQPDQSKIKLTLTDKGTYMEARFTPKMEGTNLIYTEHFTKDLGEKTRYGFASQAAVQVGKKSNAVKGAQRYQLFVAPKKYNVGNSTQVVLTKDNLAVADQEVTVISPKGWEKKIKTDAEGKISFEMPLPGIYVIEYGVMVKEDGLWFEKPYTDTWYGNTTSIQVQ